MTAKPAPTANRFFTATLAEADPEVAAAIGRELKRQQDQVEVLDGLVANGDGGNGAVETAVKQRVRALCQRFPVYP
ncbi:MAG: hypothetical protein KGJ66_03895 [Alphaproteobacteria bacterium]|nr:hypothetical protein [Alphaproteobacteria bacterium]